MRHSRPPDNSYFHGANIDTQRDVSRETPRHAMRGWLSPPCYQDDRPPPGHRRWALCSHTAVLSTVA